MSRKNMANLDRDILQAHGRIIQEAFAHGLENDMIFGGLEPGQSAMQSLYALAATKNCILGTRRVSWDGKVHRYCYSTGLCSAGMGNIFNNEVPATGIDYQLLAVDSLAGVTTVTVLSNVIDQVVNGLAGGSILLKPAAGSNNHVLQQRTILSNTACVTGGNTVITLDGPVSADLTGGVSFAIVMPSPYNNILYSASQSNASHIGISAVYVPAAGSYHWEQTWGVCWVCPQGECGTTTNGRELVWREDGSVQHADDGFAGSAQGGAWQQRAGYILDGNTLLNGLTKMMLTCDR